MPHITRTSSGNFYSISSYVFMALENVVGVLIAGLGSLSIVGELGQQETCPWQYFVSTYSGLAEIWVIFDQKMLDGRLVVSISCDNCAVHSFRRTSNHL